MAQYRTAIIACGNIARVHARAWQDVPGQPVALGALADTHPDARREFCDFFGIPQDKRYADYREMLDAEHPDAGTNEGEGHERTNGDELAEEIEREQAGHNGADNSGEDRREIGRAKARMQRGE